MRYDLVIFDLDGTLIDTSEGIFHCIRHTEEAMGLLPLPQEALITMIGPPVQTNYRERYHLDESRSAQAAAEHCRYEIGGEIYASRVYDGVRELLAWLHAQGVQCAVATMKQQPLAEEVLRYHHLHTWLPFVFGVDRDETLTKAALLKMAAASAPGGGKAVLVGDSRYDAEGAAAAGIDFVAVLYGFGFRKPQDVAAYPHVGIADRCAALWELLS